MHLALFSGNSQRNQPWIHELEGRVGGMFDSTYVHDYRHWQSGEANIDLAHELRELRDQLPFHRRYGVVAKSIGCVLTAQAIEQDILRPSFILLLGLPLGYVSDRYSRFGKVLAAQQAPITVIQNEHDPVASAEEAAAYLQGVFTDAAAYRFVETNGDTHEYTDYTTIRHELQDLKRAV